MKKEAVSEKTLVGKFYPATMMDEQRSFAIANAELEQDQAFQDFVAEHSLSDQRASLIVFGPENFMYWYGVLVAGKVEFPQGLMKYELPAKNVIVEEMDNQISALDMPLNLMVPTMIQKMTDQGFKLYENPGDSDTPFFTQELNLATKKLIQSWYGSAED